jgi:hypothetical protein
MKRWILVLSAVLGVGGLLWVSSDRLKTSKAESGKVPADFMAGSQIWIEGNSSLRRYSLKMENLSAQSDLSTSNSKLDALLALILNTKGHHLVLTLPVKWLRSGDTKMDRIAFEKLKGTEFPDIVFTLENYTVKAFPGSLTTYALLVSGKLKIAGVEKNVVLEPTLVLGKDGIRIYGTQDVSQKNHGISPYSVALVMTTDDNIVVHYMISLV